MYAKVKIYEAGDFARHELRKGVADAIQSVQEDGWRYKDSVADLNYMAMFYQKDEHDEPQLSDLAAVEFISTDEYHCPELNGFVKRSIDSHESTGWRLEKVEVGCNGIFLIFKKIAIEGDEELEDDDAE